MSSLLIKNAHVISPDVEKFNAAVFAEDGVIKQVIDAGNPLPKADKVVDIKGKMLVPGSLLTYISTAAWATRRLLTKRKP